MAEIAVEGCELTCSQGGQAIITAGQASTSVKINSKGVYGGTVAVTVSGSSAGGAAGNATGGGVFTITNSTVKCDKGFVLVKGDKANVTVAGSTAAGSPTSGVEVVTIKDAGQTDVSVS